MTPTIEYAVADGWPVAEIARTFNISRRRARRLMDAAGGKPWSKSAGGSFRLNVRSAS